MVCRYSGVLSAYGLALADVVEEQQEPCSLQYEQQSFSELDRRMEQLSKRCRDTLQSRGFTRSEAAEIDKLVSKAAFLTANLMYSRPRQWSDNHWGFPPPALQRHRLRAHGFCWRLPWQRQVLQSWRLPHRLHQTVRRVLLYLTLYFFIIKQVYISKLFTFSYMKEFGFTIPDRAIVVDDIRVRGCGRSGIRSVYKSKLEHRQARPVMVNTNTSKVWKHFLLFN